ncbi:MAG: cell division protein SepF [Clostridia bacterium]|nr:cell division protein SepF [Clostridia bacterium]
MASTNSKRKSGFSRFLDFIGLVDNEQDEDLETPERSKPLSRTRQPLRRENDDEFPEAQDDGRRHMPKTQPRAASRPTARPTVRTNARPSRPARVDLGGESAFGDEFDDDVQARRYARRSSDERGESAGQGFAAWSAVNRQNRKATGARRPGSQPKESYDRPDIFDDYEDEPAYEERPRSTGRAQREPLQRHQTVIFTLRMVDECKDVIVALVDRKSVLLNLEKLDAVSAQRVVDMMAGATFAIDASMSSAGNRTWLITPSTVDVERSSSDDGGRY